MDLIDNLLAVPQQNLMRREYTRRLRATIDARVSASRRSPALHPSTSRPTEPFALKDRAMGSPIRMWTLPPAREARPGGADDAHRLSRPRQGTATFGGGLVAGRNKHQQANQCREKKIVPLDPRVALSPSSYFADQCKRTTRRFLSAIFDTLEFLVGVSGP